MPARRTALLPPAVLRHLTWLWLAFCVAKIGSAMLIYHLDGRTALWKPLLWESSSLIVISGLGVLQFKASKLWSDLPSRPWAWFCACLAWLPLWCIVFVAAILGIRYGVYALAGEIYQPGPWLRFFIYESITLGIFYVLWLGVVFGLATHENLLAEQKRAQDVELALREAHLALLRQQLQPHFLFNALNLISATMYENVPHADTLLRQLASLLRMASAQTCQAMHPLEDELALMRDYADIMAARFEGRVELAWRIAAPTPAGQVPSMISQALLENAFKYGVEPYSANCRIEIRVAVDAAGQLELCVAQNRGRYVDDGKAKGQGLDNIRRRLTAHHGKAATLNLSELEPEGVCARLTLPCAS